MQERQKDRTRYFRELAETSERYFMPYIGRFRPIEPGLRVLEIGCGDGGNLLPFARHGCRVLGVDMAASRIDVARAQFQAAGAEGEFIASDIFKLTEFRHRFDLILCHDVIEHIGDKALFLRNIKDYLAPDGLLFMSFPAWQMPFGGHQQICRSRVLSHLPWFHLLPSWLYKSLLQSFGETAGVVDELLSIKQTRCPIETFERHARNERFVAIDRLLWFINPHYRVKFGLRPRRLWSLPGRIPYVRNFYTTSCFYMLRPQ